MSNLSDMGAPLTSGHGGGDFKALANGTYDYVIHGIVGLGLRENSYQGEAKPPVVKIKIIFEVPAEVRDDKQTQVCSYKVNLSPNAKGNFYKFVRTIDKDATEDNFSGYMSAAGLNNLLGQVGVLTINSFEKDGKAIAYVDGSGFTRLDPRLPKPVATRPTFFFNPFKPDVEVFKNTLTYYTQKEVMEALNAHQFPPELHQAWAAVQEAHAAKEAGKGEKKEKSVAPGVSGDTASIE